LHTHKFVQGNIVRVHSICTVTRTKAQSGLYHVNTRYCCHPDCPDKNSDREQFKVVHT